MIKNYRQFIFENSAPPDDHIGVSNSINILEQIESYKKLPNSLPVRCYDDIDEKSMNPSGKYIMVYIGSQGHPIYTIVILFSENLSFIGYKNDIKFNEINPIKENNLTTLIQKAIKMVNSLGLKQEVGNVVAGIPVESISVYNDMTFNKEIMYSPTNTLFLTFLYKKCKIIIKKMKNTIYMFYGYYDIYGVYIELKDMLVHNMCDNNLSVLIDDIKKYIDDLDFIELPVYRDVTLMRKTVSIEPYDLYLRYDFKRYGEDYIGVIRRQPLGYDFYGYYYDGKLNLINKKSNDIFPVLDKKKYLSEVIAIIDKYKV